MGRDLNRAVPRLKDFAEKLILKAKAKLDLDVFVVEVDRPFLTQVAYYAQGRDPLTEVNALRKRAGLGPITASENRYKITWTLASQHIVNLANDDITDNLSRAVDFGIKDKMGKYCGDSKTDVNKDNIPDYIQLGALAKKIDPGIEWGGEWKKKDLPHYQIRKQNIQYRRI